MADETVLVLTGMGVPPYSARGLQQSVEVIDAAIDLRRTINGALHDVSQDQFRKYRSVITGNDQRPPAIDGVWPGLELTVDCIFELAFPIGGTAGSVVVPGSQHDEAGFTFYRPRLTMLVTSFSVNRDEWGAVVNWQLGLEEE